MARRRRRRPWYRRRAYRLARTAVLTVALVAVGVRCDHHRPGADVAAPGPAETSEARAAGTGVGAGGEGARSGADSRPGVAGPGEASPWPAVGTVGPASPGPASPGPASPGPAGTGRATESPASQPPRPTRSGKADKGRPAPRPLPRSRATRLVIPFVGIDAPLIDLRLDSERRLPAPPEDEPDIAGWYADGPSPGEQGTAVAVGHLDTNTGTAVFGGLGELKRGKRVEVRRADGRTAVYSVDAIKSYEKDKFPNDVVYGARARPELRLITCGGNYDRKSGYSGNVVVFAHLTSTREASAGSGKR
ncbi:class F sortase [Streptomyces sp. NPDC057623]|uniref:class F sortase n=1 Tax=Streptomyces sp. NPDC057623 TaxID=3346187 RepID=UPI00368FD9E3